MRDSVCARARVCVCVCVYVREFRLLLCVRVDLRVCVCVCVHSLNPGGETSAGVTAEVSMWSAASQQWRSFFLSKRRAALAAASVGKKARGACV